MEFRVAALAAQADASDEINDLPAGEDGGDTHLREQDDCDQWAAAKHQHEQTDPDAP